MEAQPLPLPAASSSATVGALLTKAASGDPRQCRSPRSILSRFLRRGSGGGGGGGGFGCRLRLPRYCSSGATAKEDDGDAAAAVTVAVAAPKVVAVGGPGAVRESPRSSLQGRTAASFGLGASLVVLLSKGAAELRRMAELRAQMERLLVDAKAEARGSTDRSNASDHTVVKEPIVLARGDSPRTATSSECGGAQNAATAMDQMEAELEAELTRLQLSSSNNNNDDEEDACATPRRRRHQRLEEVKSDAVNSSESYSPTSSIDNNDSVIDDDDDGITGEDDGREANGEDDEDSNEEEEEERAWQGGVPARVLERKLHELLRSRHEERIAELESELERARRKLQEKEREMSRWRDTAKLASRHRDESRLR